MWLMFCRVDEHIGENEMLDQVQVIKENDQAKFAVIPFDEYLFVKAILSSKEKMEDYLDYLYVQTVKARTTKRYSLAEVKQELGMEL